MCLLVLFVAACIDSMLPLQDNEADDEEGGSNWHRSLRARPARLAEKEADEKDRMAELEEIAAANATAGGSDRSGGGGGANGSAKPEVDLSKDSIMQAMMRQAQAAPADANGSTAGGWAEPSNGAAGGGGGGGGWVTEGGPGEAAAAGASGLAAAAAARRGGGGLGGAAPAKRAFFEEEENEKKGAQWMLHKLARQGGDSAAVGGAPGAIDGMAAAPQNPRDQFVAERAEVRAACAYSAVRLLCRTAAALPCACQTHFLLPLVRSACSCTCCVDSGPRFEATSHPPTHRHRARARVRAAHAEDPADDRRVRRSTARPLAGAHRQLGAVPDARGKGAEVRARGHARQARGGGRGEGARAPDFCQYFGCSMLGTLISLRCPFLLLCADVPLMPAFRAHAPHQTNAISIAGALARAYRSSHDPAHSAGAEASAERQERERGARVRGLHGKRGAEVHAQNLPAAHRRG
jgi:hypothetical protein